MRARCIAAAARLAAATLRAPDAPFYRDGMTNVDVAKRLSQLATMLELDGANVFRIRAYREAARVIEQQGDAVEDMAAEEGRLESLAGIGKDLAAKIRDLATSGTTALFDEMKAKYPIEVVAFTELQGMGPKRVRTLFDRGIRSRDDLERAAKAGELRDLPGFGETLEKNIIKALEVAKRDQGRVLLADVWDVAHAIAERIGKVKGVKRVELAGSFRRRRETIGDLDVLACGGSHEDVMKAFTTHREVAQVLGRGETKSSVRLQSGLQVDLRHVPEASFGAALLYFTGSKAHNIELRRIAIDKGCSLNEYGLHRGQKLVAGRTEEDVYEALGMAWIPPELREASGEIALAIGHALPRLVEEADLVADLHMHTDRSDGRDTLEAMVRAVKARGYAYCAITEHSQSLAMTGGFDTARVRRSVEEIAAVRTQVKGVHVLHGLEVDILGDGALDLDEEGLGLLDWVIVSIHSRFGLDRAAMTRRVLRALAHPKVHAMGHPTGRMLGSREPAEMDLDRVFELAAERGVAMEINAQPHRTDLNDVNARLALSKGVRFVIDTDAHNVRELDMIRFGIFAARRAGLTAEHVLNARPFEAFERWRTNMDAGAAGAKPKPGGKQAAAAKQATATKAPARSKAVAKRSSTTAGKRKGTAPTSGAKTRRATPAPRTAKRKAARRGS